MFVALCCDIDVVCCCGRFGSSWMLIFIDMPIADDVEALLQDRVLIFCDVGTRHDDVIVVVVALNAGCYRVIGVFEDSLNLRF